MLYIIILVIVGAIAVWGVGIYNSLITLRERVENAKAQIAAQIESRWDTIKSLIDATKQYSRHEAETLEGVTEKRASVGSTSTINEMENANREFNSVLGRLMAVSENYPDLKASNVYQSTMNSINRFEENVRSSRMIYNDVVTRYNRQTRIFPSSIIAGIFNFEQKNYFEATEEKQEMPSWE